MRVIIFAALLLCASLVAAAEQPASIEAAKLESVSPAKPHVTSNVQNVPYSLSDASNKDIHRFTSELRLREIRSDAEYDRKIEDLHKHMAAERKEVNQFINHASEVSKTLDPVLAEEKEETEEEHVPVHRNNKVQKQAEKQAVKQLEKEESEMRFRAAPTPIQASFKETRSSGDSDVETESISAIRDALASLKRELKAGQLPPDDIPGVEQQVATLRQELAQAETRRERSTHIPTVRSKGRPGLHITGLLSKLTALQSIESSSPLGLRALSLAQLRSLEHSLRALLPVLRAYHHRNILYKKMQHRAEIERLNRMEDEIRKQKEMVLRQSQLDVASQNAWSTYQPISTTSYMYSPCYQQAAQSCSPQTYACTQSCTGTITCRASCQQAHLTCVRHYTSACPGPNQVVNYVSGSDPTIVPAGTFSGNPVAPAAPSVQPEYARFAQVQNQATAATTQQSQQQAAAAAKESADLKMLMAEEEKQKQTLDRQTQILDRLSEMKSKHTEEPAAVAPVTESDKAADNLRFVQVSKRHGSQDVDVNEFDKFVDLIEHDKPSSKKHSKKTKKEKKQTKKQTKKETKKEKKETKKVNNTKKTKKEKKEKKEKKNKSELDLSLHQSRKLSKLMAKINHEYHHKHRFAKSKTQAKAQAKVQTKETPVTSSNVAPVAPTQNQNNAAKAIPTVLTSGGFATRGAPSSPVAQYTMTPEYLDTPTISLNVQAPPTDNAEETGFKVPRAISPGTVVPDMPVQYASAQPQFNSHPTLTYRTEPSAVPASTQAPAAAATTSVMRLMEQAYNGNVEVDA